MSKGMDVMRRLRSFPLLFGVPDVLLLLPLASPPLVFWRLAVGFLPFPFRFFVSEGTQRFPGEYRIDFPAQIRHQHTNYIFLIRVVV